MVELVCPVAWTNESRSVSSVELWYLYQANWDHAVEEAEMRMRSDDVCHGEFK